MKITCIADLHSYYPELPGGDLLIVAGDLTATDTLPEYRKWARWISTKEYKRIVYIAGNHDKRIEKHGNPPMSPNIEYLCDSGTEFEGLKIWGSPYTPEFMDWAFMLTPEQDKTHWDKIPDDTNILITHGPPFCILDKNSDGEHCGSHGLRHALDRVVPKLHVFGHIHEHYGDTIRFMGPVFDQRMVKFINCSMVDEQYRPGRTPITIEL